MQYFRPQEPNHFVGDCMPSFHEGTFHLYYLLDEGHHAALGGLGGHQWAHAASTDLVRWTQFPLALPITAPWEGSICTGSVIHHDGMTHAFYATRLRDRTQHLSKARSEDGVHFEKCSPNPFASPPSGYGRYDYRDPFVFRDPDTGQFSLLVTAWREEGVVPGRGGCLAHLVSDDLDTWTVREPFLVPGLAGPPECPDLFVWRDWTYLLFSNGLTARYRMARSLNGPWLTPRIDTFEGLPARVMKTAPFTGDRRLGVAWLGTREGDRDDAPFQWGGNAVFRELVQAPDGTLGVTWPPEMTVTGAEKLHPAADLLTSRARWDGRSVSLGESSGLEVARLTGLPHNFRVKARVRLQSEHGTVGLRLRCGELFDSGYAWTIAPGEGTVHLGHDAASRMDAMSQPFELEVVAHGSVIDARFAGRYCLIDRCPEQRGDRLVFFALDAGVIFEDVEISPLPALECSQPGK